MWFEKICTIAPASCGQRQGLSVMFDQCPGPGLFAGVIKQDCKMPQYLSKLLSDLSLRTTIETCIELELKQDVSVS